MPAANGCPDPALLQRFAAGQLPEDEISAVQEHLKHCKRCVTAYSALGSDDPLAAALRQAAAAPEWDKETIARLIEQLQAQRTESTLAAPTGESGLEDVLALLAPPQEAGDLGQLGTYPVRRLLGAGGMGCVFVAFDPGLRREVALKVMRPRLASDLKFRERFLREGRAAAALKHENIVTVYQAGEEGGTLYLAMELLEGESLESRLRSGPALPLTLLLRVAHDIAKGLATAHEHKKILIHRDIKPANLWLETAAGATLSGRRTLQRVKILDFGLARVPAEGVPLTALGEVLGTPSYISPEQAAGRPAEARSDLFSLGCVLYRIACGRPPFVGDGVKRTLEAVIAQQPKPALEANPKLPEDVAALIMHMLEKDPKRRPGSAAKVVHAARALLIKRTALATGARPPKRVTQAPGVPDPQAPGGSRETTLAPPASGDEWERYAEEDLRTAGAKPAVLLAKGAPGQGSREDGLDHTTHASAAAGKATEAVTARPRKADGLKGPSFGASTALPGPLSRGLRALTHWGVVVTVLYLIILVALTAPALVLAGVSVSEIPAVYMAWPYWLWVAVMVGCQAALILVPVRFLSRRPATKRPLLTPLVVSGLMMAALVVGLLFTLTELGWRMNWSSWPGFILLVGILWMGWAWVFHLMTQHRSVTGGLVVQGTTMLTGSILELLVAVPTHIWARNRNECCAGMASFMGLTLGMSVMLFAFGPAVYFLFLHRWRKLHPRGDESLQPEDFPARFRCPKCYTFQTLDLALVGQLCECDECSAAFFLDQAGRARHPWIRFSHWLKPAAICIGFLLLFGLLLVPLGLFPRSPRDPLPPPGWEPRWQVELDNQRREIDKLSQALAQADARIQAMNGQLNRAEKLTEKTRKDLAKAEEDLAKVDGERHVLHVELMRVKAEIHKVNTELAEARPDSLQTVRGAMKLAPLKVVDTPSKPGDRFQVEWFLRNSLNRDLRLPKDLREVDGSGKLLGWELGWYQYWIERLGNDSTIPAIPAQHARVGSRIAMGSAVMFLDKNYIPPGGGWGYGGGVETKGFPLGRYRYHVEYRVRGGNKTDGVVVQTETAEFELVGK